MFAASLILVFIDNYLTFFLGKWFVLKDKTIIFKDCERPKAVVIFAVNELNPVIFRFLLTNLNFKSIISNQCHPGPFDKLRAPLDPGSSKILISFFAQSIANSVGKARNDNPIPRSKLQVSLLIAVGLFISIIVLERTEGSSLQISYFLL